ncbi:MAG: autotransporter-associated beta strand repeat-containing protein [Kiritimatiellae bacterium]|nr:autotransporter-associated beta strand repeat-containing protein [Kiritimatiellia bacterium]
MKRLLMVVVGMMICQSSVGDLRGGDTPVSYAEDMTVDSDWTLDADQVVDGTLTVNEGVIVRLNGHTLEVKGLAGDGTITGGDVPLGFTQLEYIESTSDGGQYIDTGVKAVPEATIVGDVMYTGTTGSAAYCPLISSAQGDNGNTAISKTYGIWIWPVGNVSCWVMFYDGWQYNSSSTVVQNERCTIEATWKSNERTLSNNGEMALNDTTYVYSPIPVDDTMYLPARNLGGAVSEKSAFRIYAFQIYNPQSTLVRNYVPARRLSDGAVGLFDLVSKGFFESQSGTPFLASATECGVGGGELKLNVASDATLVNSTVALEGMMTVVKVGMGTYVSEKFQSYQGGTLVSEGRITLEAANAGLYDGFGGWGTEVVVASNAQVFVENGGFQTLNGYKVTIAGDGPDGNGAIYGKSKNYGGYNNSFIGGLSLSGDASIKSVAEDAFNLNNNSGIIDIALNGHTLTANGSARIIVWSANVVDKGRIVAAITPDANGANNCFYTYGSGVFAPLADFEVAQDAALGGEQPMTVSNLVMRGTYYPCNGVSYRVTVLGRYSPKETSGGFPMVALGDVTHLSPTLDLSDLSATYDGTGMGISFEPEASVTVEVGSRPIQVGDCLVSWAAGAAPDSTVSFNLLANGVAPEGFGLIVRENEDFHGLYVKTMLAPAYAEWDVENEDWTFYTADGALYPDEWTGGVTSDMQVRFHTYEQYQFSAASGVTPAAYVMTGLTLAENMGTVDLTTFPFFVTEGISPIDLKGNTLLMPAAFASGAVAIPVTDSVGGGALVLDIESGTVVNAAISLSGFAKLVKRGAGTLVSALSQTYTGGTDVEAGTVCPPDSPADNNYTYSGDTFTAFGTGIIDVYPGAVFDMRGNYAYTNVRLKGGTITNTLRTMGQIAKPGIFVDSLADAEVSYVNMSLSGSGNLCAASYGMAGFATDLGGKTLEIDVWGDLYLRSAITNGTLIVVENYGWFRFEADFDMSSTAFDNTCAFQVNANVRLGEYIQRKDTPYMLGSSPLTVCRRFCPVAESYFYGCTLLDGCTLDLSQRATLFTASCNNYNNTETYTVTFPSSGHIYVEVGDRAVRTGDKLVAWTSKPSDMTKFLLARHGETVTNRSLIIEDDGIYVGPSGLMLFVR